VCLCLCPLCCCVPLPLSPVLLCVEASLPLARAWHERACVHAAAMAIPEVIGAWIAYTVVVVVRVLAPPQTRVWGPTLTHLRRTVYTHS
jgi:hypothetical protein